MLEDNRLAYACLFSDFFLRDFGNSCFEISVHISRAFIGILASSGPEK